MIETLYIEESVIDHCRTRTILDRFDKARRIICQRYTEVFNPKAQNFRLQKQRPALILAKKFKNFVLKAPPEYAVGAAQNYYFSHMLNCLFDCRYCFLQGMYRSAHYLVFINYEDFQDNIRAIAQASPGTEIHFFSGYDCDSLALEPVTRFAESFLPIFNDLPNAWLELRTKSTQIGPLLKSNAIPNCIVAYSFTPEQIANAVEHKTPNIDRRLDALIKLQARNWRLGLRFDPLIYQDNYKEQYRTLFAKIWSKIDIDAVHSVSLGSFRLPESYFARMHKLYPEEKLFAGPFQTSRGMLGYKSALQTEMMEFCTEELLKHVPQHKLFPCTT